MNKPKVIKPRPREVKLEQIRTTGDAESTQLRGVVSVATVQAYAKSLKRKAIFPPIVLVREGSNQYLIGDGWLRYEAHKAAGRDTILAVIHEPTNGLTALESALQFALDANQDHGLQLGKGDKSKRAEAALLCHWLSDLTDYQIAQEIGVARNTVSIARSKLARAGKLLHPATGAVVLSCNPDDYFSKSAVEEAFRDIDTFCSVLKFIDQLSAINPKAWSFNLDDAAGEPLDGIVTHGGLAEDMVYQFKVNDNEVINGRPLYLWESSDTWDGFNGMDNDDDEF